MADRLDRSHTKLPIGVKPLAFARLAVETASFVGVSCSASTLKSNGRITHTKLRFLGPPFKHGLFIDFNGYIII